MQVGGAARCRWVELLGAGDLKKYLDLQKENATGAVKPKRDYLLSLTREYISCLMLILFPFVRS